MRMFPAALLGGLVPVAALGSRRRPGRDTPPPAGAMKLSAVLAALEACGGAQLAYVDDAEWDDDGYWEVEYRSTDGA